MANQGSSKALVMTLVTSPSSVLSVLSCTKVLDFSFVSGGYSITFVRYIFSVVEFHVFRFAIAFAGCHVVIFVVVTCTIGNLLIHAVL